MPITAAVAVAGQWQLPQTTGVEGTTSCRCHELSQALLWIIYSVHQPQTSPHVTARNRRVTLWRKAPLTCHETDFLGSLSFCFHTSLHKSSVGSTETQGKEVREMWKQLRMSNKQPSAPACFICFIYIWQTGKTQHLKSAINYLASTKVSRRRPLATHTVWI